MKELPFLVALALVLAGRSTDGTATTLEETYVFESDTSDTRYFCDAGTGRQLGPPGPSGARP